MEVLGERGHELKVIGVRLLKVKVNSFSARDDSVVLEIHFNDGAKKQVFRDTRIKEPEETVKEIVDEIIRMEGNIHSEFDGERLYNDAAVIIENRGHVEKRLKEFFTNLYVNAEKVRHAKVSDGYIDMVRNVTRMELAL